MANITHHDVIGCVCHQECHHESTECKNPVMPKVLNDGECDNYPDLAPIPAGCPALLLFLEQIPRHSIFPGGGIRKPQKPGRQNRWLQRRHSTASNCGRPSHILHSARCDSRILSRPSAVTWKTALPPPATPRRGLAERRRNETVGFEPLQCRI